LTAPTEPSEPVEPSAPVDPSARDLVDVRLLDAMRAGGCPVCTVRARAERGILDAIITERVLDRGFRASLERTEGFCRRHVAELVATDRRESGGTLGASLLLAAVLDRRTTGLGSLVRARGRALRSGLKVARTRPPCIACVRGASSVDTALARFTERATDPAWAERLSIAPFCLDDFLSLWAAAGKTAAFEPIAQAQLARLDDLRRRLEAYAHHSSHDRRHLMTDDERRAADEATQALGGDGRRVRS
jgi:hypothetical protein